MQDAEATTGGKMTDQQAPWAVTNLLSQLNMQMMVVPPVPQSQATAPSDGNTALPPQQGTASSQQPMDDDVLTEDEFD